jgi:hypothetical protein
MPLTITIWKRKGGNRVRKKGKPNLWLLQLGTPLMPKRHPHTKWPKIYPASNARSQGIRQGIAQSHPQNPVKNAPK